MTDANKILGPGTAFADTAGDASLPEQEAQSRPLSAYVSLDEALTGLLRILVESGNDPVSQLAGFLITEDPAYLPDNEDARALARRLGRDKLLEALISSYLDAHAPTELK